MKGNHTKVDELLRASADITAWAVGGVSSVLLGGPIGGAVGGALGASLAHILGDVADRALSLRERARIGTAAVYAIRAIKRRLAEGQQVRTDGFFTGSRSQRSAADQLFEGLLLASKNEYEEKKLVLLGNLMASIVFKSSFSSADANLQMRRVEQLSYRQLCVLVTIFRRSLGEIGDFSPSIFSEGCENNELLPKVQSVREIATLFQEIFDLYQLRLVVTRRCFFGDSGWAPLEEIPLNSWRELVPVGLYNSFEGETLVCLIEPDAIPKEDWERVAALLRYKPTA